jgi:hypothetical protein
MPSRPESGALRSALYDYLQLDMQHFIIKQLTSSGKKLTVCQACRPKVALVQTENPVVACSDCAIDLVTAATTQSACQTNVCNINILPHGSHETQLLTGTYLLGEAEQQAHGKTLST